MPKLNETGIPFTDAEKQKRYRKTHPGHTAEYHRRWRKENPEKNAAKKRRWRLKYYGITSSEYQEMFERQDGKCAICKNDISSATMTNFCIDHDHQTGKVRGLLCAGCNFILGNAKDDCEILLAAVRYLRNNQ